MMAFFVFNRVSTDDDGRGRRPKFLDGRWPPLLMKLFVFFGELSIFEDPVFGGKCFTQWFCTGNPYVLLVRDMIFWKL